MNARVILMVLGTLGCIAAAWLGWDTLRNSPTILVIDLRSFNAFVGWAFVLCMAVLPLVCLVGILRGWFAYFSGPQELAVTRLVLFPSIAAAICLLLYGIARVMPANL